VALGELYTGHMTRQMTATEVKAQILGLLDEVADGDEIEITKHGRTVARLVPARGAHTLKGRFAGAAISASEDDALFTTGAPWSLS
jgi:prevent-host-death family protein